MMIITYINQLISIVDTYCFLGIQLDSNETFDKAITNFKNKALRALFKINMLLNQLKFWP